ncbi:Mobile element protein [Richelia intracellularis]|nr:Mobile element protein [Richelia intracellularis]CDN15825.1 Mobile element protein [Richelia intracellularis]
MFTTKLDALTLFICSPFGRKRFNVLGAVNAVTKKIITITNETYINSESLCQLLLILANMGLNKPIVIVLDKIMADLRS